jgi:RNA polymerase sigma-70 factor, ECF subfamily
MPLTSQTSRPAHAKTPQTTGADSQSAAGPTQMGELVAAAQTGGGVALERLLAEARPKLLSLAMRVLNDADEAEDAVQDAMIKVWRNLGRFEGRAAFTTWLHRIAVNAALDRLRRRGSVPLAAGAPEDHHHDTSEPALPETPERIFARAETAVVVRRAMGQLSETHGEALRLCDLEGESYATIAEVTECPLGTVMSRLFHARRKLARALTETATDDGDLAALRAA